MCVSGNRAATIEAETAGHLWAMDRQTFRRILLKSAFRKRKMYESLLDSVPMLKTLQVRTTEKCANGMGAMRQCRMYEIIRILLWQKSVQCFVSPR